MLRPASLLALALAIALLGTTVRVIAHEHSFTWGSHDSQWDCRRSSAHGAGWHGRKLRGRHIERCDLSGATGAGANLSGADLRCVNLEGANLRNATFEDARLVGVSLRNAKIDGARSA